MKPVVLAILDGWGISPVWGGNAIEMYSPTNFNSLWRKYPHLALKSFYTKRSFRGSLANSEIGHMMMGTGREVISDCEQIDEYISTTDFYNNQTIISTIDRANKYSSDIHLLGMISEGCIHSSLTHLISLLKFYRAHNFDRVYIHCITDGRDVEEVSAGIYIDKLLNQIKEIGVGKIATVCGRHFAMDRDGNWDRSESYFRALIGTKTVSKALDAKQAIHQAYQKQVSDEFIPPTTIIENGYPVSFIKNNDQIILFNFRSDRIRQLYLLLCGQKKLGLFTKIPVNLKLFSLIKYHFSEYQSRFIEPIFKEKEYNNSLIQVLSENRFSVLKVAETEKLAHVTYFFNGGIDKPFPSEKRTIIRSKDDQSYIKFPQMRAREITDTIIESVNHQNANLIVVNYANVDEVAHTGDILATSKAVQAVDEILKDLQFLVNENKITLIVTADHGNGEQMVNREARNEPEMFHTYNPVPFILADKRLENISNVQNSNKSIDLLSSIVNIKYSLKDVAPTILSILSIPKPVEMTGTSLLSILNINSK